MSVILVCGKDLTEEMHDYWCRKGSNDCLNETASIHNSTNRWKIKKFFPRKFIFYCSLPNGGKKGSVILQVQAKHFASNASCFHQKIVLSPEVASATGKMPQRMVAHESSKAHSYHDLVTEEQKHLVV